MIDAGLRTEEKQRSWKARLKSWPMRRMPGRGDVGMQLECVEEGLGSSSAYIEDGEESE